MPQEEDNFILRPRPMNLKSEEKKKDGERQLGSVLERGQEKLMSCGWEFTFIEYLLCARSSCKCFL